MNSSPQMMNARNAMMNARNGNATTVKSANGTQVLLKFPPPQKPQTNIVVMPQQPCMKNCAPRLSAGCDLCACAGDYYFNPLCASVGITGMLTTAPCLVYDEQWGGCGNCIGCQKVCDGAGFCPYPGLNRQDIILANQYARQNL